MSDKKCAYQFELVHKLNSAEVYLFQYKDEVYYAKKFILSSLEENLSQFFKKPKGVRCITTANALAAINIKVPDSVFTLSFKTNLLNLHKENIYLTKKYNGIPISDFIVKNIDHSKEKVIKVLKNLASDFGVFYKNNFMHRDPHIGNFLVSEDNYEIAFIDLNAIHHHYRLSTHQVLQNLANFNTMFFYFLLENKLGHLYTAERIQFYLSVFLESFQVQADLIEVFDFISRKTLEKIVKKGNYSLIPSDSFLAQIQQ